MIQTVEPNEFFNIGLRDGEVVSVGDIEIYKKYGEEKYSRIIKDIARQLRSERWGEGQKYWITMTIEFTGKDDEEEFMEAVGERK